MFHSVLQAVFTHADNMPDKLCLADETRDVTYAAYRDEIRRTATALCDLGVKRGDRVVVEASQTISYLASQLAMNLMGAVFVPVERGCAWSKTLKIAQFSGAAAVVVLKPQEEIPQGLTVITQEALAQAAQTAEPFDFAAFPEPGDLSELLFSTGTTGKEKGIAISFDNNIALAENVIHGVCMQPDNVEMIPSPMNHSHGLRRYYANMVHGATVILFTSVMNVKRFFDMVERYNVNSMDLVPSALSVLLKLSKQRFAQYSDVLRYIQFGSAPLVADDMQKICQLLPNTRLYNFYGSTESGCIAIFDFNTGKDKPKCIGKPAINAHITIVDENRNPIASSEQNTGLLASFGRMNMLGYWQDEEETARALINGTIYSNDEAYFDEDGDIILLGRKGDTINTGGNKVSPDEIQEAALKHSDVADCGCIGVPDALLGSAPKLYVQLKPGCAFDYASLRNHLSALLEPYKVPSQIEQIDQIPRTFNGKLLRRALREAHDAAQK